MKINVNEYLIDSSANGRAALQQLDFLSGRASRVLFVMSKDKKLVGSITDGDIRRGLLAECEISDPVSRFMNDHCKYVYSDDMDQNKLKQYKSAGVDLLPVVSQDLTINSILDLKSHHSIIPVSAFIMAGGRGERMRPLTDSTPKPLLRVGDKPILEHNIDRLIQYGVEEFFISIRYLGDSIKQYFGDGHRKGIRIQYVEEIEPLGTAGALSLASEFSNETILLMNSDLLTTLDFADFFLHFQNSAAQISASSIPYTVNIPYGVFEIDQMENVLSLREKPSYTYYSNAGIYLLKKDMLSIIPSGKLYNATDLMEDAIRKNMKVVNFPILGYWLDIGKQEDFVKAQLDIKHLDL